MIRVGIIAGESSGDLLGAGLIEALKARCPEVHCAGIAGPRMIAQGCEAWEPAESLAVMGLFEVLSHLPRLLRVRRTVLRRLSAWRPDVFVGVDSPEFNFGIERVLKKTGIPTVQYVSPQVWAWRQGRVKQITRSTDLVLCLLPFEKQFYDRHGIAAEFVGHPLADQIPMETDAAEVRARLGIEPTKSVIALLPGSRIGEVKRLGIDFLEAALWLASKMGDVEFVAPMASRAVRELFARQLAHHADGLRVRLLEGEARPALGAADAVLVASGTATLETMLVKRPMVVAYRVSALTDWVSRRLGLLKVPYIAMPNLLAGEPVVPEFLQHQVEPAALGEAILKQLNDPAEIARQREVFAAIHQSLRCSASQRAADAVLKLVDSKIDWG